MEARERESGPSYVNDAFNEEPLKGAKPSKKKPRKSIN